MGRKIQLVGDFAKKGETQFMRKILLRTLLLCAVLVVLLIPAGASAKKASATATPTISVTGGSNYQTKVNICLNEIPDDGNIKASESVPSVSASITSSDYLRIKFTPQNGAKVDSVVATVTKSGVAKSVELDLYDTASNGQLTYRGKINGTVTQVDINLLHSCKYDYKQIPATTTKATCTEDGTLTRTCIYCNGTDTQINEKATGHAFTKKLVDAKYLKSAATCTEDAVYVYSCCYCGEAGTETFKEKDTATGHDWGDYETTTAATCTENGVKTRACSVCQATETATIPATGHQYSDYVSDNNATCTEDGTKTQTCAVCNDKHTVANPGSAKGHQWDNGVVTKEPTEDKTGSKTFTCQTCNATYTEVIPKLPHTHAYTESVVNDNTLAQSATCTSAARYYKSCECGDISRDATFESGSSLPHSFTNYIYDGNATCTADGTRTAICDSCGQAKDTVAADGTATGHLWDKGQVTVEPTVDHEGEMTYTCQKCQATKTETLAKLEPEKPNPATPTPGTTDPTTPNDPSKDNTAAGDQKQTLTAGTDAAKTLIAQTQSPQTGDNNDLMLWTALLLLSGVSLTSAGLIRRCR